MGRMFLFLIISILYVGYAITTQAYTLYKPHHKLVYNVDEGPLEVDLDRFSRVFVLTPNSKIADDEADALIRYVLGGGTLIISNDDRAIENTSKIINYFGWKLECGTDTTINRWLIHPITTNFSPQTIVGMTSQRQILPYRTPPANWERLPIGWHIPSSNPHSNQIQFVSKKNAVSFMQQLANNNNVGNIYVATTQKGIEGNQGRIIILGDEYIWNNLNMRRQGYSNKKLLTNIMKLEPQGNRRALIELGGRWKGKEVGYGQYDFMRHSDWSDFRETMTTCGYEIEFNAPVPEPCTMLLMGSGLAGLAGIARRRRRQQQ
jgi:hypothetical protein